MAHYKGVCGSKDAVTVELDRRAHIWVDVTNNGTCSIKVRFGKSRHSLVPIFPAGFGLGFADVIQHFRELTKTVRSGKHITVDRDEVNYATISCDDMPPAEEGEEEEEEEEVRNCDFTYSIRIE